MSKMPEYVLDRVFDASREIVWRAWTDPDLLSKWYGPNVETVIHKFDLKPGGFWLNEMKWGENSMLSKMVFDTIEPPERLIWLHYSSTDANWNPIANPNMPDWPRVLLTNVIFSTQGTKTKVRLTWTPHDATEAEITCFSSAVNNMGKGWESGYAIMDELLADLQAENI